MHIRLAWFSGGASVFTNGHSALFGIYAHRRTSLWRPLQPVGDMTLLQNAYFGTMLLCALGIIIEWLCRRRVLMQLLASLIISMCYFAVTAWLMGTLSNQISLRQPLVTLYWMGLPYVFLFFLPIALPALLVGWLSRYRRN